MAKVFVVATLSQEGLFLGDVVLVTEDEDQARTYKYQLEQRRPIEGLDYSRLNAFSSAIYFERELGKTVRNI